MEGITDAARPELIGERLEYLYPDVLSSGKIPRWPPDVFCLCAAILHRSGAYSVVADKKPPHLRRRTSAKRAKMINEVGERWRASSVTVSGLPAEIQEWWEIIRKNRNIPVQELNKETKCLVAFLDLLAAADATSYNIGIYPFQQSSNSDFRHCEYTDKAERQLFQTGLDTSLGATLCKNIHPSKARVLPKMHAPQSGLTIRSFSHYLAYCEAPGVFPEWLSVATDFESHNFNLLLIPWPSAVRPSQFRSVNRTKLRDRLKEAEYGLFTFDSAKGPSPDWVKRCIRQAQQKVGQVHGVIFPELSMSEREYNRLSAEIVTLSRFLAAGVGSSDSGAKSGVNEALIDIAMEFGTGVRANIRFNQGKHHRWKITKSQVLQYGLGSTLHPEANWWESISLRKRSLSFATFRQWLTLTVLICEDLARPDPVADVVRAVGPNLIIALLADAPQLSNRWPGRYAGAFADDPGSSVLTLTSAGMTTLSSPVSGGVNRSGVVALWRDPFTGVKELQLPINASGLLLNLTVQYATEWTADGRGDKGWSGYPILAGVPAVQL